MSIELEEESLHTIFSGESSPNFELNSITEIIDYRWKTEPDKEAFTYLLDGDQEAIHWTYRDLKNAIASVSTHLNALDINNERVLLLFEPGLAFITAYLATISSGAVAVPCHPPMGKSQVKRLWDMIESCDPKVILHSTIIGSANLQFSRIRELAQERGIVLQEAEIPAKPQEMEWVHPEIDTQALAMLQYTSASTGDPKGVMVTQDNLVRNCEEIYHWLGPDPDRRGCIWLPPYHDMGLLGGIMQPLYAGFPLCFMSPMHFIQRPLRWLKALSDHKLSLTGAPNFAFQLCVDAVSEAEIEEAQLDLRHVKDIFCGSEPINPETMEAFYNKYRHHGLHADVINPCYGLAEVTLFASGRPQHSVFKHPRFQQQQLDSGYATPALKNENSLAIVSCGLPAANLDIRIVKPDTDHVCDDQEIGEVWISGPSVTKGYWNNRALTDIAFNNTLTDTAGEYYRTGDLGFMYDGELYINGRLKEIIIIRGRNIYPQDVERCALKASPLLENANAAAFSIKDNDTEALVVVIELKARAKNEHAEEIKAAISASVRSEFNITPHDIYVGPRGTVPRTTSGKIQRNACKRAYQSSELRAFKGAKL